MSQTSCGLEQLGRELSCLANKHGSLTKSRNGLRHRCAAPASASSLARRLPANFPFAVLCFLLPALAKAQVTRGAQAAGLLPSWSALPRTVILTLFLYLLSGVLFHSYTWAFRTYTSSKSLLFPCWRDPVVISSLCSDLLISPFSTVPSHISYVFVFLWENQELYVCLYIHTHVYL